MATEIPRASDLMIPVERYPSLSSDCTLREAALKFLDRSHDIEHADGRMSLARVLLVIDEGHDLVGIIRRRDILRGLEPGFLASIKEVSRGRGYPVSADPGLSEFSYDHQLGPMKSRSRRRVREVMLPIGVTVEESDHLFKIIELMVSQDVSLIPVLRDGRVTGAVRSVDVLRETSRLILTD